MSQSTSDLLRKNLRVESHEDFANFYIGNFYVATARWKNISRHDRSIKVYNALTDRNVEVRTKGESIKYAEKLVDYQIQVICGEVNP